MTYSGCDISCHLSAHGPLKYLILLRNCSPCLDECSLQLSSDHRLWLPLINTSNSMLEASLLGDILGQNATLNDAK